MMMMVTSQFNLLVVVIVALTITILSFAMIDNYYYNSHGKF